MEPLTKIKSLKITLEFEGGETIELKSIGQVTEAQLTEEPQLPEGLWDGLFKPSHKISKPSHRVDLNFRFTLHGSLADGKFYEVRTNKPTEGD